MLQYTYIVLGVGSEGVACISGKVGHVGLVLGSKSAVASQATLRLKDAISAWADAVSPATSAYCRNTVQHRKCSVGSSAGQFRRL